MSGKLLKKKGFDTGKGIPNPKARGKSSVLYLTEHLMDICSYTGCSRSLLRLGAREQTARLTRAQIYQDRPVMREASRGVTYPLT
jgi:hypothetical protein